MPIVLIPSDDMIKQAAYNSLDLELWKLLTDDDHIVEFLAATKALRTSLRDQLAVYKTHTADGLGQDIDWYNRIKGLERRIIALLDVLRQKIKERNRRVNDNLVSARYGHLCRAIRAHRRATLAGSEPTEQDRLLWVALNDAWSMDFEHRLLGGDLQTDAASLAG
jgi:hypothetical protein